MANIENLINLTKNDMEEINNIINDNINADIPLIQIIADYLINSGGKRIRPMLCIAVAHGYGCEDFKDIHKFATAMEFIHSATLLHDDVIDMSEKRRGKDCANIIHGNKAAILVGDYLFSRAFSIISSTNNIDGIKTLSNASNVLAQGEILQLGSTNNPETTYDEYIKMISFKTSPLFSASCYIGSLYSNPSNDELELLNKLGENIGNAFQMVDDALDYIVENEDLDKNNFDDFSEGKVTYPIIHIYQNANQEEKNFIIRTFKDLDQNEDDKKILIDLIKKYDALDITFEKAQTFINNAIEIIEKLTINNNVKTILKETVQYIMKRKK